MAPLSTHTCVTESVGPQPLPTQGQSGHGGPLPGDNRGDISKWVGAYDYIPQRCKSGDDLCRRFVDQANVRSLLNGKSVTIFRGYRLQLYNWSLCGCPFARLLTSWFPLLCNYRLVNITLCRVKHPRDMPVGLQLLHLSAKPDYQSMYLEMVTDQHDPAISFLAGRAVSPDPLSSRNLTVVSGWLSCCMTQSKGHEECPKWELTKAKLPTRVISVSPHSGRPKLYITRKDEVGRYAALSYCWGGPQPHQTRTANLAEYTRELPMEQLPATIMDAIRLAQALSIPYLWIDSLCIVQDSEEDKVYEIATMDRVYKNSWVTISAARASTCLDGFLGIQEATAERVSKSVTIPVACPDGSLGTAMLSPTRFGFRADKGYSNVEIPVNSRAWTYQETLISPRTISYYHNSIEFKCLAGLQSSDGLRSLELAVTNVFCPRSSTLEPYFYLKPDPDKALSPVPDPQDLEWRWRQIVYDYSAGELSDPDDKLPALSAIASEFHRVSGANDIYLAGLWRRSLLRDLLWARAEPEWRTLDRPTAISARRHYIPTWSWASIDSQISFSSISLGYKTVTSPRVEILDYTVSLASTSLAGAFGCVDGGRLVVRGPVQRIACADAWALFSSEDTLPLTANRRVGTFCADYRWGARPAPVGNGDDRGGGARGGGRRQWGIPCDRGSLWLLGLAMKPDDRYETFGLILVEASEGKRRQRGILRGRKPLRFLSLAMRSDGGSGSGKSTNNGSRNSNSGYCERAGVFCICKEYFAARGPLRIEMERFMDRWGDGYEIRTMTIR